MPRADLCAELNNVQLCVWSFLIVKSCKQKSPPEGEVLAGHPLRLGMTGRVSRLGAVWSFHLPTEPASAPSPACWLWNARLT